MNDFYNRLTSTLQREQSYITDNGEIKKWLVINAAQNYEKRLIELLIDEEELRNKFFIEVNKHLVFNERLFISFMENKNYFNDSYTRFKNKIGLSIDGKYLSQRNEVSLVWPFKDCILEGGQSKEEQKKEEIFFNELLAQDEINQLLEPKVMTNWKRYTVDGEQKVTEIKRDANGLIKENLILKGNNLLALYSLKPQFEGKIKLIYIDPPYNTGNDSFGYNDSFNHSTWLTFMKNRLEIAKQLLKPEGVIFISIDDTEVFPLKVLCDEIFGPENYIRTISYQRGESSGIGQSGTLILNTTEFILVYGKDKPLVRFNGVYNTFEIDKETMKRYKSVLINPGKRKLIKTLISKSNGEEIKIYKHENESIENISLKNFDIRLTEIKKEFSIHYNNIFRTTNPQSDFQQEIINQIDDGLFSIDYIPSRGNKKGVLTTNYFHNKGLCAWLKDTSEIIDNKIMKKEKINDFWAHGDIPKADLANEGNVTLKRGKKPEQLLKRIIDLCASSGDVILDFFIGSGTTAAVAHKMQLQYIGIEQLDYSNNDSVTRLKNVIGNKTSKKTELFDTVEFDQSGVAKSTNWQGGGEFLYIELCKYNESFIEKIEKSKDTKSLLKIWEDMKEHSFLNYNIDIKKQDEAIDDFKSLSIKEQKQHLCEILNKNQLYVNLSSIEDSDFQISKEDKALNSDFYGLNK